MKKYLFVVVTLGMIGVSAESNPFDLQKNLQKIDNDQEVLLSALQEMAGNKDEFADDEPTVTAEEATVELVPKENVAKKTALEEERIEKVKEAQEKIEEARARQEKEEAIRAEAARIQKAEEERREVEAYEAHKLAKKIEAEKLAEQERLKALKREKAKKEEQRKIEAAKEAEAKRNAIVDINVTKEEMLAKEKADQAYREAIKEMD